MNVVRARVSDANFPSLTLRIEDSGGRLNYRCRDRAEFDALTGSAWLNVTLEGNRVLKVELTT